MKRIVVMAGLSCALNGSAWAAPEEIQVYLDELNAPGQLGLDLHSYYVMAGAGTAAYSGAQPALHVFRLTPEFSYGLTLVTTIRLASKVTMPWGRFVIWAALPIKVRHYLLSSKPAYKVGTSMWDSGAE